MVLFSVFVGSNRKIDPSRRVHLKLDGTPDLNDRVEIGPTKLAFSEWEQAGLCVPDLPSQRQYRLSRLQQQVSLYDCAGLLLFDPLNIRYATDTTNMQVWIAHNAARACFVPPTGKVILFDFHNCEHLSEHLPLVGEVRGGSSFFYFETGNCTDEHAAAFAGQITDLMRKYGGNNRRLAVDKIENAGYRALQTKGVQILDGQVLSEHARSIKDENELRAMRCAVHACERAVDEMRLAVQSGVTENDVWAELHAGNIRRGGEWIETRILASWPRTNRWFQECGPRVMQSGDMLAFDTDLISTYGYCCDISCSWIVDDLPPNDQQKHHYQVAYDHVMTNIELLKPGMSFSEVTAKAHRLPSAFRPLRYGMLAHGIGLCDEYPSTRYPEDAKHYGYDGCLEHCMTLFVEAYVGAEGGHEGVKLEEQIVITATGAKPFSSYPYETALIA